MRALAATALTLAFIVMAAITYFALMGDPMGGEPRLVVKVTPPDAAKLQPSSAPAAPAALAPQAALTPAPAAEPPAAALPADPATPDQPATGTAEQPPQPAAPGAAPAQAEAATPPDPSAADDIAGVTVTIPK